MLKRALVTLALAALAGAMLNVCFGARDAACQSAPGDTLSPAAPSDLQNVGARADTLGQGQTPGGSEQPGGGAAADSSANKGRLWELDRIAAIVNNSIILLSEVEEQTFLLARQRGLSLADSASLASARKEVLDRLIEEKVIEDEARKRGMTVSKEDVDKAVEGVFADMKRAAGSDEAFMRQLDREGLTEQDLRDIYEPRLEAQILASRLVRREVGEQGEVTDTEVEEYYEENKESFPERPESVRLSHIYVSVVPDSVAYERALEKAKGIRARIIAGEDFATLARENSADPSAAKGGDLGYFVRGQLDPFFDEAVFSLKPGEVSDIIKSRLGFHLIKLTYLKGDTARASHILIPVAPTSEDMQRALSKADRIKSALDAGADFAELARSESEDPETRELGGDLGYFAVNDLTGVIKKAVLGLRIGEISNVVQAPDGYHIFLKTDYKAAGKYTLDETQEQIREFIRNDKLQKGYERWIEELKKGAYIDVKVG
jgi:peptidyl-prolyl cis-trans isomerase SurA